MDNGFEKLIPHLRAQYQDLKDKHDDCELDRFLWHVESLCRFHSEPMDYLEDDPVPEFPREISVAYAICHPECGMKEFIVDGSTQECMLCGGSMFRMETITYKKAS